MRCTFAPLALAVLAVANPVPQGVTSAISPQGSAPAGCQSSYAGTFQIQVVKAAAKRDLSKRAGALIMTLNNGILMDAQGRTGYIASNYQFQFDGPPQAGAIYTAGWSVCANGSLAIGPDAVFYQCLSGTFYNLYDQSTGAQCSPVYIDVIGGGTVTPPGGATQISDGQVTASAVTQISDGQIQATTATGYPVTQISDGQIQATTATAGCTQISDGQPQCASGYPVTQISDGQIQATTATGYPVTQISDGQIQATTAVAGCTQISDGQPQCATGYPVTQISDGQIQATTATGYPVTQISDGQIQATTATGYPVTQISDGQVQAPTVTAGCTQISDGQPQCSAAVSTGMMPSYGANTTVATPSVSVVPATGAAPASNFGNSIVGLIAGVLAVAFL